MIRLEDLDSLKVEEGDRWSLTFITNALSNFQSATLRAFKDRDVEVDRLELAQIQQDLAEGEISLGMAVNPAQATTYTMGGTFLAAGRSAYVALRGLLYAAAAAAIPIAAISFTQKSDEVTANVNTSLNKGINILWLLLLIYAVYKWETR